MNDTYFTIVSKNSPGRSAYVGILCSDDFGGTAANTAQRREIFSRVSENCTRSLGRALEDNDYNNPIVFETRAEAREAVKELNASPSFFEWQVLQMGNVERRVKKVKHWEVRIAAEHGSQSTVYSEKYATRSAAREAISREIKDGFYKVVPVYA